MKPKLFISVLILISLLNLGISNYLLSSENIREIPKRLANQPDIQIEWLNGVDDCDKSRVCVEGLVINSGGKPAYAVHLKVELGGTQYIKPKINLFSRLDSDMMEPGDRQLFYFELDRQIPYRSQGKVKVLEVGKYTYKVVPQWEVKRQIVNRQKKRWLN